MANWFRSEYMEYISIIVNEDAGHDCLADLGKLGVLQFTDLNPDLTPFQRRYVAQVKRCEDLERKLRYFASECDKFELTIESAGDVDEFMDQTYPVDQDIVNVTPATASPELGTNVGTTAEPGVTPSIATPSMTASVEQEANLRNFGSVKFESIDSEFYHEKSIAPVTNLESIKDIMMESTSSMVTANLTPNPSSAQPSDTRLLENLDAKLENYEKQLLELNDLSEKLTMQYNEKVELQEVLQKARKFFMIETPRLVMQFNSEFEEEDDDEDSDDEDDDEVGKNDLTTPLLEEDGGPDYGRGEDENIRFSSITGVVGTDEKNSFERIIFRATRGNCFVRFIDIRDPLTDPYTGYLVEKTVFIIFYQSLTIETKLKKICDAFSAHRYALPDMGDIPAVEKMMEQNNQELQDSRLVLNKNKDARYSLCQTLAQHTERWTWTVLQEKAIYHSLNMFKSDVAGVLRGEGWVVANKLSVVTAAINKAHAKIDRQMPSVVQQVPKPWPTPPTHFTTNKFTYAYQEFVNTYGIPRYREANPALFTAATFPFLFGVMYGDIGHGTFLFTVGLFLLFNEKKNDKAKLGEMGGGMHAARYMITMMGFFAIYAGFIYNDCFSLGLNLFGSRYVFAGQEDDTVEEGELATNIAPYGSDESVYPFGLDPAWHVTSNDLLFFNSFKMKLSVTFGIAQMSVGTGLKGLNAIYYREKLDFFFEFIPMVVFASSLFVYMIVLIFMKWVINWNSRMLSATCIDPNGPGWNSTDYEGQWIVCDQTIGDGLCTPWGYSCTGTDDTATKCPLDYGGTGDGCQPPNLITTLINIALSPGSVDEPMYEGQANTQNILLVLALISVPTLLCVKPYLLSRRHPPKEHAEQTHETDEEDAGEGEDEDEEEHHDFGEIFIHQAIETIEFVLGMVSNTASYLRLWALSLAHSELAEVFWEKSMLLTLNINWFATYLGFGAFAGATFLVLLSMDVLECFLHALRLHWVEFQNKFFKADGIKFAPYSFKKIIDEAIASSSS